MTSSVPAFSDPMEAARFGQYKQMQIEEYGTYIAASDIFVGTARAFAPGHPVPKSTAEAQGWDRNGMVVPAGTPLPVQGDRGEMLRARAAELERERLAIEAELAVVDGPTPADYEAMTVVALRDELATRQLSTSGNKPELVARLQQNDSGEEE